jgi:hypothetical protein
MDNKHHLRSLNPRHLIFAGIGLAFLALAAALGLRLIWSSSAVSGSAEQSAGEQAQAVDSGASATDSRAASAVVGPAAASASGSTARPVMVGAAGLEASPYTRQLVADLTNLDLHHGGITEDQAAQWKKTLQTLTEQGAAAVPAIREFLGQNWELEFTSNGVSNLLGQRSLRSAMIGALSQIGPDATDALLQTLQGATLPSEIVQLAQALEQQAPGQYHQQTVDAMAEVAKLASEGQLPVNWDLAPLFKLLQTYGDSGTASALERFQTPFGYYATMSLAGMDDGAGLPALMREATTAQDVGIRDFAFQMLAQAAIQQADAGSALLEQAKADQIPVGAWQRIAAVLAGEQYQIGQPPPQPQDAAPKGPPPGLKTYHIAFANENFYSVPLTIADIPADQFQQRLALIDQLLAATPNAAAQAALRSAHASLTQIASN